jgi:hypothetical protein
LDTRQPSYQAAQRSGQGAAMNLVINTVRGLITLALLILFVWLVIWAYSKKTHSHI